MISRRSSKTDSDIKKIVEKKVPLLTVYNFEAQSSYMTHVNVMDIESLTIQMKSHLFSKYLDWPPPTSCIKCC